METKEFYECQSGVVKLLSDDSNVECFIHVITPKDPQGKFMKCVSFSQAKDMFDLACKKLDPEILMS